MQRKVIMYRVLVFGMTENPGGVESFLMNYYRNIDKSKIQFDFLCNSHAPVAYEDELIGMGARTYHITARSTDYRKYKAELEDLFRTKSKEWDAIWVNISSLANIDYLKMAKKYGIRKRIIHSHNSRNMDSKLRGFLHKINRLVIKKYATDFWACAPDAAQWFYTNKLMEQVIIIHNAIDVEKFAYDEEKRKKYRKQIGCTDEYLIGNIGRFHFQKNQMFLLDVFAEILKIDSKCALVLIGQGEDEEKLKKKAVDLNISEKVYFVGIQKDIPGWLSALDLFLFPSVFEGLSVVALEAQANGVTVLASKGVITEELRMNDNFMFFSLDKSPYDWGVEALAMKQYVRPDNEYIKQNFKLKGYDIQNEVKKIEDRWLKDEKTIY